MSRRTVLLRKKLAQRGGDRAGALLAVLPRAAASHGRTQITTYKYKERIVRVGGWQVYTILEVEDVNKVSGRPGLPCTKPISPEKLSVWKRNIERPKGKR